MWKSWCCSDPCLRWLTDGLVLAGFLSENSAWLSSSGSWYSVRRGWLGLDGCLTEAERQIIRNL